MTNSDPQDLESCGWRWVAQSVVGPSHALRDAPCQDYASAARSNGRLYVAIADGAGSASLSQIGSKLAVEAALPFLAGVEGALDLETLRGCAEAARSAVLAEACKRETEARDLACTLLLAAVEDERVLAAQVGDGAIVAAFNGEAVALTTPQHGEYANQTNFLTGERYQDVLELVERPGTPEFLAGFTDGLETVALNADGTPFAPFFAPLYRFVSRASEEAVVKAVENLLRSDRLRERTDDDLTLVLAWKPEKEVSEP